MLPANVMADGMLQFLAHKDGFAIGGVAQQAFITTVVLAGPSILTLTAHNGLLSSVLLPPMTL